MSSLYILDIIFLELELVKIFFKFVKMKISFVEVFFNFYEAPHMFLFIYLFLFLRLSIKYFSIPFLLSKCSLIHLPAFLLTFGLFFSLIVFYAYSIYVYLYVYINTCIYVCVCLNIIQSVHIIFLIYRGPFSNC